MGGFGAFAALQVPRAPHFFSVNRIKGRICRIVSLNPPVIEHDTSHVDETDGDVWCQGQREASQLSLLSRRETMQITENG